MENTNTELPGIEIGMDADTLDKLEALAKAATPQNFDSAQIQNQGHIECPTCDGSGEVELTADYCNYDGRAIGVQFYGIGPEYRAAEAFYRAANPQAVQQLIALARSAITQQAEAPQAGAADTTASASGLLNSDELAAFNRFCECAEDFDSGGHDVDKEMMAKLARIGVVRSTGFGRHETTAFGDMIRDGRATLAPVAAEQAAAKAPAAQAVDAREFVEAVALRHEAIDRGTDTTYCLHCTNFAHYVDGVGEVIEHKPDCIVLRAKERIVASPASTPEASQQAPVVREVPDGWSEKAEELVRDLYNFEKGRHFAVRLERIISASTATVTAPAQPGPVVVNGQIARRESIAANHDAMIILTQSYPREAVIRVVDAHTERNVAAMLAAAPAAQQAAPTKPRGWLAGDELFYASLAAAQRSCDAHNAYERSRPDFDEANLLEPEPVYSAVPATTVMVEDAKDAAPEQRPREWQPVTGSGQVRKGDKLRFKIGDKEYNERAKLILHSGTNKEEVIYDKSRNFYFITSMVMSGKSNHKCVEFLAAQQTQASAKDDKQAALQQLVDQAQERCPHCDDTGDVHSPTGEWRGACTCPEGVTDSEGGHHD